MMSKKSIIAQVRGDVNLAEDWANRYIALYDTHFRSLDDSDDEVGSASARVDE